MTLPNGGGPAASAVPAAVVRGTADVAPPLSLGRYTGEIAERFRTPDVAARLAEIDRWIALPSSTRITAGRNRNVRVEGLLGDGGPAVLVKSFGRLSALSDARDARRGSKARRSFVAAEHLRRHGVGTPTPVAYVERWSRGRLLESHFVTLWQQDAQTLREALATLFNTNGEAERFVSLLERVAQHVREMHDAGFVHNDLGPTNVLVVPDGAGDWRDVQVVDLNRGRLRSGPLDVRERARDQVRLALPSHLLQIFAKLYWRGTPPSDATRWQRKYLRLHGWRVASRRYRHPLREARLKRLPSADAPGRRYPAPRDMWIWDERTAQPLNAMLSNERARHFPLSRYMRMASDTIRATTAVWREYRPLVASAFRQPVAMSGRIGMAVDPPMGSHRAELALLGELGRIPAFVRFYRHEPLERRADRVRLVHALHAAGHPVAIALVQDRIAVRDAAAWRDFVVDVMDDVAPIAESVELGHCINRVKWGIWSLDDVAALYAVVDELRSRYPRVPLHGPATIDFDAPFTLTALREWPAGAPLAALSQHLYVDRRGAPESPQNGFALVEKLALGRAIARVSPACDDRLVVTEVNWPLEKTAPYSPVGPPFVFPWQAASNAGYTEDEYADYMLRYYVLALASGLAERVYWWRLVAHGYGLVDDHDPANLRRRPAYEALKHFLALVGDATFVNGSLPPPSPARHGRYRFAFVRRDGETVVMTYAHGPDVPFEEAAGFAQVEDTFGRPTPAPAMLGRRPVYLRGASS